MSTYTVKQGDTILDVVENATGARIGPNGIDNWDVIVTTNGFDSWTPDLVAGQLVAIPDDLVDPDPNILRQLKTYPVCNNLDEDVLDQLVTIISILDNNWILTTGFWNDRAVWIDTKTWID